MTSSDDVPNNETFTLSSGRDVTFFLEVAASRSASLDSSDSGGGGYNTIDKCLSISTSEKSCVSHQSIAAQVLEIKDAAKKRSSAAAQDLLLKEMGVTQSAKRHFSLITTFGLSSSILSVFVGVVPLYGNSLSAGGPGTMLWMWIVLGFMSFLHCLCLAEMSSAYPSMGTMFFWSRQMGGADWGPFASWMTGWFNLLGQVASVGAATYSAAFQVSTIVRVFSPTGSSLTNGAVFGVFLLLLVLCGVSNMLTEKVLTKMGHLSVFVNIFGIFAIVIILLSASAPGSVISSSSATTLQPASFVFTKYNDKTGYNNLFYTVLVGALSPAATYTGYDTSASVAEEALDSGQETPLAMLMSVANAVILGSFFIIGLNFSIQDIDLITNANPGAAFSTLVEQNVSSSFSAAFAVILGIAMQCSATATLTSCTRLIFAFSREKALPASTYWSEMDQRFNSPVRAVWLCVFLTAIMGAIGLISTDVSQVFFSLCTSAYYSSYFIPVLCRVTVGWDKEMKQGEYYLGRWSRPLCLISGTFCMLMAIVLCLPIAPGALNYAGPCLAATAALATCSWFCAAKKWFMKRRMLSDSKSILLDSHSSLMTGMTGELTLTSRENDSTMESWHSKSLASTVTSVRLPVPASLNELADFIPPPVNAAQK